jgi:hypothetical protein
MFQVGGFSSRDCRGLCRRSFLQAAFAAPFASGMAGRTFADDSQPNRKAKSVILLWLWGGPSHIDTFDPKPSAPMEIRGPFSAIATRTPGIHFSELFPRLAARSHLFSVVRSNTNLTAVHRIAGSIALTGGEGENGDDSYSPNFGSVVQRMRSGTNDLPPFITVTRGQLVTALGILKGYGGGKWGKAYDPFQVTCSQRSEVELPSLKLLDGLDPSRLHDRNRLLSDLDQIGRIGEQAEPENWNTNFQRAYRLLTSPDGKRTFDLNRESEKTKGKYGRTAFGQSCLLARRLVEAGVPYIQVNWSKWVENIYDSRTDFGWDTHWLNFEHMVDRHGPILDRALSGLLDDLNDRGLLDSTLVVAMGEFGRTPKVSAKGGRDHWPQCYSTCWAGAGIQSGRVVGGSDNRGYAPLSDPVTPEMVGTTILEQAGIDTAQRAELRIMPNGRIIDGLV